MIKKILFMAVALLLFAGLAYADSNFDSGDNVIILGAQTGYGPLGMTPPTLVQKVYVEDHGTIGTSWHGRGANANSNHLDADTGVEPGDVMVWSLTQADGYTVRYCSADSGGGRSTNDTCFAGCFSGVMVTRASRDTSNLDTPAGTGYNVGYMAVRGFCQAGIDCSESMQGQQLILNGETVECSFATTRPYSTRNGTSQDIGILLEAPRGADGLHHVVLR